MASAFGETALQCAALTDNVTRLACYDRIFAAQLPSSAGQEGQESKAVLNLTETVRSSLDKGEAVIVVEKGGDALPADSAGETADIYTPLSLMYDLDKNDLRGLLGVREHNPMYLMPLWYNNSPNYARVRRRAVRLYRKNSDSRNVRKPNCRFRSKAKLPKICLKSARICGSATPKDPIGRFTTKAGNPRRSAIRITNLKFS